MLTSPFVSGESERVACSAAVAVGARGTMAFGTIRGVAGDRVVVEVAADLAAGEAVELKIDLSPAPGTALARGTVLRSLLVADGEAARYSVRVDSVADADVARCADWLEAIRLGGTMSTFSGIDEGTSSRDSVTAALRDAARRPSSRG